MSGDHTSNPGDPAYPAEIKVENKTVGLGARHFERVVLPGITAREYACIHLKVPCSGAQWLDELILKSRLGIQETLEIKGVDLSRGVKEMINGYLRVVQKEEEEAGGKKRGRVVAPEAGGGPAD